MLLAAYVIVAACNGGSVDDNTASSTSPVPPSAVILEEAAKILALDGFEKIDGDNWDETAVRKVLRTFAYGGHPTENQISVWADTNPEYAIVEMLEFGEHNLLLSPSIKDDVDDLTQQQGTLLGLSALWGSDDPENFVVPSYRQNYKIDGSLELIWILATLNRGLNPFRQKYGMWETNYHMAVNLNSPVKKNQLVRYYDDILTALETRRPYHEVLETAALSAAVAAQYGHRYNRWTDGLCKCNEDFAREYHQLFFGINGEYDPAYHEEIAIKNTAAALTGMPVPRDPITNEDSTEVEFITATHAPGVLDILHMGVGGNTAQERIQTLSPYAIEHVESQANLPAIIITGLADDILDQAEMEAIRAAWSSMTLKDVLTFIRGYAISTLFHSPSRTRFLTSVDRFMLIANLMALRNEENYARMYLPQQYHQEDIVVFKPNHNVFGGQTPREASERMDIFRNNYNRSVQDLWWNTVTTGELGGRVFEKDWSQVIPADANGEYIVEAVAEWLWTRFIGDGLKNFGPLERAQVYGLLSRGADFIYLADFDNLDRVAYAADLQSEGDYYNQFTDLADDQMWLSGRPVEEPEANRHIGLAVNFIIATPFMFADEGR